MAAKFSKRDAFIQMVICIHFFHFRFFFKNFKSHDLETSIILYSIHFRKVVKIFDKEKPLSNITNFP